VLTPSGSARIADLRAGDAVLSFDMGTSSMVATTIRERFERTASPILRLETGLGVVRGVTDSHPVYHVESGSYLPLGDILGRSDRTVLVSDGTAVRRTSIESFDRGDAKTLVYTLAVESVHANFFADGLLVHNKGKGGNTIADAVARDSDAADGGTEDARGDQGPGIDGAEALDAGVEGDAAEADGHAVD